MSKSERLLLPFDPAKHPVKISQGHHGPFSHSAPPRPGLTDLTYAVDFALPPGTEVYAPQEGEVLMFIDDQTGRYTGHDPDIGRTTRTSFVLIAHQPDRSVVSCLSHLAPGSVSSRVRLGQRVKPGDIIGVTAPVGWVPEGHDHVHHHLSVRQGDIYVSRPARFEGYSGTLEDKKLFPDRHRR